MSIHTRIPFHRSFGHGPSFPGAAQNPLSFSSDLLSGGFNGRSPFSLDGIHNAMVMARQQRMVAQVIERTLRAMMEAIQEEFQAEPGPATPPGPQAGAEPGAASGPSAPVEPAPLRDQAGRLADQLEAAGETDLAQAIRDAMVELEDAEGAEGAAGPEGPEAAPADSGFEVQEVYPPNSEEATALFTEAAQMIGVPESWASSAGLHNILQRESGGVVGRPNYTYGHRANDRSQWDDIHAELRDGKKTARSSATGLGQLLLANVDKYYPSGREGIGDPLEEAAGMLAYIKDRYGNPDNAWSQYGVHHEGY